MPDASTRASSIPNQRLIESRAAAGLTQSALARQVGVSRQFLNQMEAGRVLPNVALALRLATALSRTVEELFSGAAAQDEVAITLVGPPLVTGARLRIGRVESRWIAHPAETAETIGAGFSSADAVLLSPGRARLLVAANIVAENILIAGCDPALSLLQASGSPAGGRCHWIDCGSGRALDLLAAGEVHVAGIHYPGEDGIGNIREMRSRAPDLDWRLVRFTRWDQGWLVRPQLRGRFTGVSSLANGKWTLANRDLSTAARRWLDQKLASARIAAKRIRGYESTVPTAADAARAVAQGQADVTIGPRALAAAHALDFIPGEAVDFDLAAPTSWWRGSSGRRLRSRIEELAASGELATLPGYSPTASGRERSPRRA